MRGPGTASTSVIGPSMYRTMSTLCVPLSISTPPPLIARVGVPARAHVHDAGERVLQHQRRADRAGVDHLPRSNDVVDEAELRGHREEHAVLGRRPRHPDGAFEVDAEGLLAKDGSRPRCQIDRDRRVRDRRCRDDDGVAQAGLARDPDATGTPWHQPLRPSPRRRHDRHPRPRQGGPTVRISIAAA